MWHSKSRRSGSIAHTYRVSIYINSYSSRHPCVAVVVIVVVVWSTRGREFAYQETRKFPLPKSRYDPLNNYSTAGAKINTVPSCARKRLCVLLVQTINETREISVIYHRVRLKTTAASGLRRRTFGLRIIGRGGERQRQERELNPWGI